VTRPLAPRYLLPSLAIFALLAFLSVSLVRLLQLEKDMRLHVDENMLWVVTQAQVAGHRLVDDLHLQHHGDTDANPALRYDILVSRLTLMNDGPQRRYLEALGLAAVLDQTLSTLSQLEPKLRTANRLVDSAAIHRLLTPLLSNLNSMANAIMVEEWESAGTRIDIYRENMIQVIGLIVGILISGLALVALLIQALRQQNKVQYALALHRDQLEQDVLRRTSDLEAERQRVVTAIETAPDGFAAFDNQNHLVLINPQFSRLLPLPSTIPIPGQRLHTLLKEIQMIAQIEDGCPDRFELDTTGHLQCDLDIAEQGWRQLTLCSTRDGGHVIRVADITRYKAAAKSLERSLQLERGVSEFHRSFASMVSHQFRTPLSVVDSGLQRLLRRGAVMDQREQQQKLQRMRESVAQMVRLLESSLTAARLDSGDVPLQTQPQDLQALIQQYCLLHEQDHSRIQIDTDASSPIALCDPTLVEQILSNLFSNAIKYSPADSPIRVRLGASGQRVYCAIEDEGVGISSKDRSRLFERFFRSKSAAGYPGVGLGLNISLNLARIQRGDITVDSIEGKGATFTLWLPRERAPSHDYRQG